MFSARIERGEANDFVDAVAGDVRRPPLLSHILIVILYFLFFIQFQGFNYISFWILARSD
jgi:hypothetical protein